MYSYTIDELVDRIRPDYVSVDNPMQKGGKTPGTALVSSIHLDVDRTDGLMMYVTIER